MANKQCFLISPIGEEGSETRILADKIRAFLKYEILNGLDYECIRADDINKLGMITSDIIAHIIDCDLVIAVLENNNANVYYELALRHATAKPCISIASREKVGDRFDGLPFDTQQERVFKFPRKDMLDYTDGSEIDSTDFAKFKNQLINVIKTYNEQKYEYQNPVTMARHKVLLPRGMTMQGIVDHIDEKMDSLYQDIGKRIDTIEDITNSWVPQHLESIVGDMYRNGSAMYISGEKEAFETLCEMTKKAEHSIRTSRFAPQAISTSHSDFFEAVCRFGKRQNVTCKRIMCMNESEKESDILKTVLDTCGGSMELYLTNRDNNFELVVIDTACAFLHFYDDQRHIKSTLFIRGQSVVKEFEKIYDRFLEDSPDYILEKIDCSKFENPTDVMTEIPKLISRFKQNKN